MGGTKYFVPFIDDYSNRLWVYSIKMNSDLFLVFKEFKAHVELEIGKRIKCLRTNNGREYVDGDFVLCVYVWLVSFLAFGLKRINFSSCLERWVCIVRLRHEKEELQES